MTEFEQLQTRIDALEQQVALFAAIDPELAIKMLTFWLVLFITSHAAGRVVRWLGKT